MLVYLFLTLLLPLTCVSLSPSDGLGPPRVCRCHVSPVPTCAPASPSPAPTLAPGMPCEGSGLSCADKYVCGCDGTCRPKVSLNISYVSDDTGILYTCGGREIAYSTTFDELTQTTYEGACDDLLLRVQNFAMSSAVALVVQKNGQTWVSGTRAEDLDAEITWEPKAGEDWEENVDDGRYETWLPGVVVDALVDVNDPMVHVGRLGAKPLGVANKEVGEGFYAYRYKAKFC